MSIKPFFVVWNPKGNRPVIQYQSHDEAQTEALRLATIWKGQEFFVLTVTGRATEVEPRNWTPVSDRPTVS